MCALHHHPRMHTHSPSHTHTHKESRDNFRRGSKALNSQGYKKHPYSNKSTYPSRVYGFDQAQLSRKKANIIKVLTKIVLNNECPLLLANLCGTCAMGDFCCRQSATEQTAVLTKVGQTNPGNVVWSIITSEICIQSIFKMSWLIFVIVVLSLPLLSDDQSTSNW